MNSPIFDARAYNPEQGIPKHPIGKYPSYIVDTGYEDNKEKTGKFFRVRHRTPQGEIDQRFNMINASEETVRIAHNQLAALCYATGVFQVNVLNGGKELINAQCMIEVTQQEKSQYTQVSKVFYSNGDLPTANGPAPAPAPAPAAQTVTAYPPAPHAAPPAPAAPTNWPTPAAAAPAAPPPAAPAWPTPAPAPAAPPAPPEQPYAQPPQQPQPGWGNQPPAA